MVPRLVSRLWWRRYLARNARPWGDLERFPTFHPDQQRRELASRLLDQIRYFGRREDALPEWREAARLEDPEELWRVWPSLPILRKKDLQTRFSGRQIQERFPMPGRVDSTGGSTGEPVHFYHDDLMVRTSMALNIYTRIRMGWRPGMPTVIVWGAERDIGKASHWRDRIQGQLLGDCMIDGYHLSDATVDRVVAAAEGLAPASIYGFTSMLEYVARRAAERSLSVAPGAIRTAWNGGEMLFPEQSALFERVFGVPILNRYGGRELSAGACQFERGGPLHVMRPWLFVEVVDERGKPAVPGEPGRLLWTSTVCRGTPFLRYDVEDLGSFRAEHCGEAGVVALDQLLGRVSSLLRLPDGRMINNIYWNHLFKEFVEIRQFQVRLRRSGVIQILLSGTGMNENRDAELRRSLAHLRGGCPVELSWVESIPRNRQGKLVHVLQENDTLLGDP